LDVARDQVSTSGRREEEIVRSGGVVISRRISTGALEDHQAKEIKVVDIVRACCGHAVTKDSYQLPDGRWTCNSDACRKSCSFICQRVLPARELWCLGGRHVCSRCLLLFLAWALVRGVAAGVRALLIAIDKYT
jgi:hypothetical protein